MKKSIDHIIKSRTDGKILVSISNYINHGEYAFGKAEDGSPRTFLKRRRTEEILLCLARCWKLSVFSFCIMGNHYHKVILLDPVRNKSMSDREIAFLYSTLWTKSWKRQGFSEEEREEFISEMMADRKKIAKWRENFCDYSVFMQHFSEGIAKIINHLNGTTGAFWRGRSKARVIRSGEELLAAMLHADLNPVRAGLATSLVECKNTAIYYRLADPAKLDDHELQMREILLPIDKLEEITGFDLQAFSEKDYETMATALAEKFL